MSKRSKKTKVGLLEEAVAMQEGRKASIPLHVMLEPAQMERYKRLQQDLNLPMREVVVLALDALANQMINDQIESALRSQKALEDLNARRHALVDGSASEVDKELDDILVHRYIGAPADGGVDSLRAFTLSLAQRISKLEAHVQMLASEVGLAP